MVTKVQMMTIKAGIRKKMEILLLMETMKQGTLTRPERLKQKIQMQNNKLGGKA